MNKEFKTVQEAFAKNREILDKLASLDEIAKTRELNEEEKKEFADLQREYQGISREITYMNQQAAAAAAAPATVLGSSASEPATTAAPADTTDEAARESARISQSREIAALQREILYENEYNSITY